MRFSRAVLPQWDQQTSPERPLIGPLFIWGWGVLVPVLLLLYGLACILRQEAMIIGGRDIIMLYGIKAQVAGIALMAVAGLVHIQCFWNALYDSTRSAARAKFICLLVLGASTYFLCFHMLTHMR